MHTGNGYLSLQSGIESPLGALSTYRQEDPGIESWVCGYAGHLRPGRFDSCVNYLVGNNSRGNAYYSVVGGQTITLQFKISPIPWYEHAVNSSTGGSK